MRASLCAMAVMALGRQAQGFGHAALHVAGAHAVNFPAGDPVVRTQPQPAAKMFGGGKLGRKLRPQFAQQHQGGRTCNAGHLGQVHPEHAVTFRPRVELPLVALRLLVAGLGGGQRCGSHLHPGSEGLEQRGDLFVAFRDEGLVRLPERVGLLQREEVFHPPVAPQTFRDDIAAGFDAMILERGERLRIAFAFEDGLQDGLAGDTGQVADDVLELHVHLRERLVQVAHATAGPAHQRITMPQQRTHGADLSGRPEAATQQAHTVEVLQPLAVLHIGLATRQIFAMARVDQTDFQSGGLEDLKKRNLIDAGGLHRHGGDAAGCQPVAQGVQILGEGGKRTHGPGAGAGRHGHVDFARADVDAGSVQVKGRELGRGGTFYFWRIAFGTRRHRMPLVEG